jgi:hypothetical protein
MPFSRNLSARQGDGERIEHFCWIVSLQNLGRARPVAVEIIAGPGVS